MSRNKAEKIEDNRVVALRFVLKDDAGETLEEATVDDPLVYLHGHGQLLEPVEEALTGKEAADRFEVTLTPDEGFGARVDDPERTIPRDLLPPDADLSPGDAFALEDEDGEDVPLWVVRATTDHIVVSLCHPFAGKTVTFEVEVLKVRDATPEELEHGHAHGIDGTAADEEEDEVEA